MVNLNDGDGDNGSTDDGGEQENEAPQIEIFPRFKRKTEIQPFRISIEVPGVPRFLLTFDKGKFMTIKQFVHFLCV